MPIGYTIAVHSNFRIDSDERLLLIRISVSYCNAARLTMELSVVTRNPPHTEHGM